MLRSLQTGVFKHKPNLSCETRTLLLSNMRFCSPILFKYCFKNVSCLKLKQYKTVLIHLTLVRSVEGNNAQKGQFEASEKSIVTQEMLLNQLATKEELSFEEWDKFKVEIINAGRLVNKTNIDANIIGICLRMKHLNLAKSYLSYLEHHNKSLNFATIGKLLRLYYITQDGSKIDKCTQGNIISLYNNLLKKSKILDSTTADHAIHALSLTSNWRECLKLLEMIKIINVPNASTYSVMAAAAFVNEDDHLGWKLLNEMRDMHHVPLHNAYMPLLECMESNKIQFKQNVVKLFEYFSQNDIRPPIDFINKLTYGAVKIDFHCQPTEISRIGVCQTCNETLSPMKLSNDEYEDLKKNFYTKVILGNDIFRKSNPQELEKYLQCLDKNKSYDMVIDGLNIAYSTGIQKSPQIFMNLISAVVKHFIDKGQRVMVFGRAHMAKWPREQLNYIAKNSILFLAENISQDDPFLLYAAMNSGPNTGFLSRDLMRSHAYKMGDQYFQSLFRRWQYHNQHQLNYVDKKKGIVNIKYPIPYMAIAQHNGSNWHVPYEENTKDTRILFELPKKWICVSMSKKYR